MDTFNPRTLGDKKGSKLNLRVDTSVESPHSSKHTSLDSTATPRQQQQQVAASPASGTKKRLDDSPASAKAGTPNRASRKLPPPGDHLDDDDFDQKSPKGSRTSKKLSPPSQASDDGASPRKAMTPTRSAKNVKKPEVDDDSFEMANPLAKHLVAQPLQRGALKVDTTSPMLSPVARALVNKTRTPAGSKDPASPSESARSTPTLPPSRALPSEPPPSPHPPPSPMSDSGSSDHGGDKHQSTPKQGFSPMMSSVQAELMARIKSLPADRGQALVGQDGTLKVPTVKRGKSAMLPMDRLLAENAGRYKSTSDTQRMMHLSMAEQAFMPGDLVHRLGESAGQLPPTPSFFVGSGAILFVDVSGFTKLSETLRAKLVPVQAAEVLASTIRKVLEMLALACLNCGGDVAKFAGDALLCVWDNEDVMAAEIMARRAAVDMLTKLKELNALDKTDLQIHGGIGRGSILHFHLGSADDDLRTYIIAGEAVSAATTVVDVALPGEFCVVVNEAHGLPVLADDDALLKHAENADQEQGVFSSARRSIVHDFEPTALGGPKRKAIANQEGRALRTEFINEQSKLPAAPPASVHSRLDAAVIREGLPQDCNVYVPTALRGKLDVWEARSEKSLKDAFRRRVGILFVELEDLRLTEDELVNKVVADDKLRALDASFINMTRITQAFGGEVRDMLFDDKGCIFISVFGAHTDEEIDSDNRWINGAVRTAMAINREVPMARLGVTVGTCFVGMVGPAGRRTDFCVIGNDVNMAARYMAAARPGQLFVSSAIKQFSEGIEYGLPITIMVGKKDRAKKHTVFSPLPEQSATPEFRAMYRSQMRNPGTFVGRQGELDAMRAALESVEKTGKSCVVLLQGRPGVGKRSLCKRVKGMGMGRIKIASGEAFASERGNKNYTLQKVVEAYTGVRPAMSQDEIALAIAALETGRADKINVAALASVLPWIDMGRPSGSAEDATVKAVAQTIFTIIRLAHAPHGRAVPPRATMLILEECQYLDAASCSALMALLDGLASQRGVVLVLSFAVGNDGKVAALVELEDQGKASAAAEKARVELCEQLRDKAKAACAQAPSLALTLGPLVESAADLLAGKLLRREVEADTLEKLFESSKGDPLHVQLLIGWLREKHWFASDKQGPLRVKEPASAFPATAVALVKARLALLPPKAQTVLMVATSAGCGVFDGCYVLAACKTLEELDGTVMDAKSVNGALHMVGDAGFIYKLGHRKDPLLDRWTFAHEVVRQAVHALVDGARAAALNKRAEEAREDLWARLRAFDMEEE